MFYLTYIINNLGFINKYLILNKSMDEKAKIASEKNSINKEPIEKKRSQADSNVIIEYELPKEFEKSVKIERKTRCLLFVSITLTNIILNMDHGTIPAATSEIQRDLDINNTTLGTFGSLVYLGNFLGINNGLFNNLGALLLTKLIYSVNRKILTISTILFNGLLIYSFTVFKNIYYLFLNRILVGMMQVIFLI